jgi:hypothetical protein
MEVISLAVDLFVPNPWNPNKMPEGTLKKLKLSIEKFGLFNAILVREKGTKYEIIDGEWRWKAFKELKIPYISCRVIEATDEEVKQMIFAKKITGKHNAFEGFLKGASSDTLQACNLDKSRLERKTKYMDFKKGDIVQKGNRKLKNEKLGLPVIDEYKCILAIPLDHKQYENAVIKLLKLDKNISTAFLKALGE